jgi:hypothetical protein
VAKLSGCLDELSTGQRRVLVLRAGVGAARPHSRRATAQVLRVTIRRVRRLERSGLRRARTLSRAGACGGGGSGAATGTAGAATALTTSGGGTASPGTAPEDGAGAKGGKSRGGSGAGAGGAGSSDQGAVRGESDTRVPPVAGHGGGTTAGGVAIALSILLIALAALAGYATPHVRGRLRSN